jgi:hypothetical protein
MGEILVVYAKSCHTCSTDAVGVFSHEPTEDEIRSVTKEAGGMFCIKAIVQAVEVDRGPVEILKER